MEFSRTYHNLYFEGIYLHYCIYTGGCAVNPNNGAASF